MCICIYVWSFANKVIILFFSSFLQLKVVSTKKEKRLDADYTHYIPQNASKIGLIGNVSLLFLRISPKSQIHNRPFDNTQNQLVLLNKTVQQKTFSISNSTKNY